MKATFYVKITSSLYERMDGHLIQLGLGKSHSKATLYVKITSGETLIVSIYIDNILITGSKFELI